MPKTQLRLDFSIESAEGRKQFLDEYLDKNKDIHWNDSDIQMMGNYILWGKEGRTSAAEHANVELETRHNTWQKKEDESLDALMEQPTFNEAAVFTEIPTKITRTVFSREEALREAPEFLRQTFVDLFRQIDELDLLLNYYDLGTGKRIKEPRKELLEKFTNEEQMKLRMDAADLSQYQYLKKRHLLVELRKQQFTLRDSYSASVQRTTLPTINFVQDVIDFDGNIPVFPLGVATPDTFMELIFKSEDELIPSNYTEEQLEVISKFLWNKKEESTQNFDIYFDFREESHLGELFQSYLDLSNVEDNVLTAALIKTIDYYREFANLSDLQKDVLEMKINKKTNDDIRVYINKKYDKHYAVNYISTIFRQKIIPALTEAANYHLRVIENLFFEEEFKTCIGCGRTLLIDERNFMHKARSKDGFNNKCKVCEKERRKRRKDG